MELSLYFDFMLYMLIGISAALGCFAVVNVFTTWVSKVQFRKHRYPNNHRGLQ